MNPKVKQRMFVTQPRKIKKYQHLLDAHHSYSMTTEQNTNSPYPNRRSSRTCPTQYATFLSYMQNHKAYARSGSMPGVDRFQQQEFWQSLSNVLNSDAVGPRKTSIQWQKVWVDWKSNVRKKAGHVTKGTPGVELTALEERLMEFIGPALTAEVREGGFDDIDDHQAADEHNDTDIVYEAEYLHDVSVQDVMSLHNHQALVPNTIITVQEGEEDGEVEREEAEPRPTFRPRPVRPQKKSTLRERKRKLWEDFEGGTTKQSPKPVSYERLDAFTQVQSSMVEVIQTMATSLAGIAESQAALAQAEDRKATALERLAEALVTHLERQ